MKNILYSWVLGGALALAGCQTSTPQASNEVKKQLLGRKPTAEEMQKAMGDAGARFEQARTPGDQ